jgi:hypothetical protein
VKVEKDNTSDNDREKFHERLVKLAGLDRDHLSAE